ncbi:hypothetical protein JCM10908_001114 [Rhodotorula pacifica]|uniref:uncharacterized protein n=1 Tax=Rhodotorula pacifica TaxID=1495444 RepID=UPI00317E61B5
MSKDSLGVTASIWSRLPNEEQYTAAQSRAGRLSPSARSTASTASSSTSNRNQASGHRVPHAAATTQRTASPHSHYTQHQHNGQTQAYLHQQQHTTGHFTTRDFAPSPRSSASTSGGSFPPTPDSSTSPHDRHGGTKVLAPGPPGAHHHPNLASAAANGTSAKRFSPQPYSSSLGLYPEPVLEASESQEAVTVPASTRAPPPATTQAPAPSSQPLLAEVFSGNPRPHYRPSLSTSALAPYQQYRPPAPGGSVSVDTSPYPSVPPPPLVSPPAPQDPIAGTSQATRSYFAPPPSGSIHGRARSASIATVERTSMPVSTSTFGASSEAHAYAGMDAYSYGDLQGIGASNDNGIGADQHGWKPSGAASAGPISASLPTVSAVGSPSRGGSSVLPHPASSSVARGSYSPFGWNEDSAALPTTAPGSGDREGRSRFRDLWGNTTGGASNGTGAGLSTSAGSTGGIGMSNMSPFSRDGSKLELDAWGGLSGLKSGGPSGGGGGPHGRLLREHSLGAVGTGRKRSDAALWGRPTLLREVEDEDGSDEDADVFHPPTRSGATSRRHSFAAFDPPNRGATTQIGFHLSPTAPLHGHDSSTSSGGGFGPILAPVSSSAWGNHGSGSGSGSGGGLGSSAINDDDLAADLNSLHLNLEVAAASNEPPRAAARNLHVGSMPVDFPPARASRALEHSRSPPPPRDISADSKAAPAHAQAQPQPQGTSPRATAEPFTPSMSSSVGSRFLLQGLQAPTPLPPATTPVVATASPSLGGPSSQFDAAAAAQGPQHQYQHSPANRYSPYGQLPPPITTQHQYFTPATAAPSALSPRGPPPPRAGPGAPYPGYGNMPPPPPPPPQHMQHGIPGMPPPSVPPPPPQPSLSYFNAPPPPPPGMLAGPPPLTAQAQTDMNLGRGVPLHAIPPGAPLCIVGFKAGRKDLFFCEDPNLHLEEGDLVIVEADRGRDVGKYLKSVTVDEVHKFQQHLVELALGQLANGGNVMSIGMNGPASVGMGMGHDPNAAAGAQGGTAQLARMTKECQPKRIFAKAGPADTHALLSKAQDEVKALALVRSKVAQKGLPMEILDAEWQWDRRKLTFYYTADTRVDFRELVRELFRIWKTRVWLCCLDQQQPSFDIQ